MTKKPLAALALAAALILAALGLAACSGGSELAGTTWYTCEDDGSVSVLTIDEEGKWSFVGGTTASGDWTEHEGGSVVLTGANGLVTIPMRASGEGDGRTLSFDGDDPMSVNGGFDISTATFYTSEEAAVVSAD